MAVKMAPVLMNMAPVLMKMAPGAIPRPGRVPEQSLCPLKLVFDGGGAMDLFMEDDRFF